MKMNTKYMNDNTSKLYPQTFTQTKHAKEELHFYNTQTLIQNKTQLNQNNTQTKLQSMLWRSEP